MARRAGSAPAPGPITRLPRSVPDVHFHPEATPRVVIELSAAARRDLDREAYASRPRTISAPRDRYAPGLYEDGVESGGYLFGRFTRDALADVDLIIGAGANAVCTPNSVTFEANDRPAGAFESELRDVFDNRSTRLIGDFHTHPNGVGEGRPSAGDLRAWARMFERIEEARNASRYVGLIGLCDGGDGRLFRVDWHAWVVQRTTGGRMLCEPACLEGQR
jgi:proteasome lid subunit RPN8/RPN11